MAVSPRYLRISTCTMSLLLASLVRKLRGHYNYYGVIGNLAGLYVEHGHIMKLPQKW